MPAWASGGSPPKSFTSLVTVISWCSRAYGRTSASSSAPCQSASRTCSAWIPSFSRYVAVFGSMFSSRRKRHPPISGSVRIDTFGTIYRLAEVHYRVFALSFGLTHLSWVVVIVRQRVVHVSYVEIVPIGNGLGVFTSVFDEGVHLPDADSTATNVGLAHELACDPPRFTLSHVETLLLLPQKHTVGWAMRELRYVTDEDLLVGSVGVKRRFRCRSDLHDPRQQNFVTVRAIDRY